MAAFGTDTAIGSITAFWAKSDWLVGYQGGQHRLSKLSISGTRDHAKGPSVGLGLSCHRHRGYAVAPGRLWANRYDLPDLRLDQKLIRGVDRPGHVHIENEVLGIERPTDLALYQILVRGVDDAVLVDIAF